LFRTVDQQHRFIDKTPPGNPAAFLSAFKNSKRIQNSVVRSALEHGT